MKKLLFFIMMLVCCAVLSAQDVKKQINSIKKDVAYINAETTDENREEALTVAMNELVAEIGKTLGISLSVNELQATAKVLEVPRGEYVRVFVYALKEDLKTLKETPVQAETVVTEPAPQPQTVSRPQAGTATSVFSRMNTLTEIKSLLSQYRQEGKISEYNGVKSLAVAPDACVIIFRGETIAAILLQEVSGTRINYFTNKEDNIGNYHGCSAIWYKE